MPTNTTPTIAAPTRNETAYPRRHSNTQTVKTAKGMASVGRITYASASTAPSQRMTAGRFRDRTARYNAVVNRSRDGVRCQSARDAVDHTDVAKANSSMAARGTSSSPYRWSEDFELRGQEEHDRGSRGEDARRGHLYAPRTVWFGYRQRRAVEAGEDIGDDHQRQCEQRGPVGIAHDLMPANLDDVVSIRQSRDGLASIERERVIVDEAHHRRHRQPRIGDLCARSRRVDNEDHEKQPDERPAS